MSNKPIYIDRGDGDFERFNGALADLQLPGWPDFFPGLLPLGTTTGVSSAADHVYSNESAPADLLTMKPPTQKTWDALIRFIATADER